MPNASRTGRAGHPKNIIFLTADAFGVMPPIAKLTPAQAMYHFLSGYTAKVAGTEKGLVGVEPEFSTCFGAPFLPRPPAEYGNLLRELIAKHKVDCWLVNSGWTGGIYGVGRRMPIKATRALVTGALDGSLKNASFRTDPYFGFAVPTSVPGVEPHLLYPMKTWKDKAAFDETARKLVRHVPEELRQVRETTSTPSARRGAGGADRGGIIGAAHLKGRAARGRPFVERSRPPPRGLAEFRADCLEIDDTVSHRAPVAQLWRRDIGAVAIKLAGVLAEAGDGALPDLVAEKNFHPLRPLIRGRRRQLAIGVLDLLQEFRGLRRRSSGAACGFRRDRTAAARSERSCGPGHRTSRRRRARRPPGPRRRAASSRTERRIGSSATVMAIRPLTTASAVTAKSTTTSATSPPT